MGLSVLDLVKSIGGGVVNAIPGGSLVNSLIDLPSGRNPNNNPYVPDVIEGMYAPGNVATNTVGGCSSIPVTMQPQATTVMKAPPGYVVVNCNGQKVAMLKPVARALGLWKPRKKPPISASQYSCIRKANSAITKIDNLKKMTDSMKMKPKPRKRRT